MLLFVATQRLSHNQKKKNLFDEQNLYAAHSESDRQAFLILCQVQLWNLNIKITYYVTCA